MAKTEFPTRPRRDDPNGYMTVWEMLQYLRDALDKFANTLIRGTSTVAATTTVLVVTHGLGNATFSVALTPGVNPGGAYWVSNKTATQFQINLAVAAPVGGVPFDWIVKGA